jgi:lipopolysaccharide assembly protein A
MTQEGEYTSFVREYSRVGREPRVVAADPIDFAAAASYKVPQGLDESRYPARERPMRWFHIIVVVLFGLGTAIFAFQNLQTVTLAFLGFSVGAPLALLVLIIYVLGMVTGGSLFALLRRSIAGSRLTG